MTDNAEPNVMADIARIANGLVNGKQEAAKTPATTDKDDITGENPTAPAVDETVPEGQEGTPEGEQAEDGADEAEQATEPTYTAVIGGKSEVLPVSKLIALAQQGADYTQKTQALASERKTVEAAKAEVGNLQKQYAERLTMLEAALKPQLPTPEAMNAALQAGRNTEYLQMQNQLMQYNAVIAERQQVEAAKAQEQQLRLQATMAEESRLLYEKLPEFKEEAARKRLGEYLVKEGIPQEEVDSIYQHNLIVLAEKARRWDELQTKKPELQKRVENLPKLAKSTARPSKGDANRHALEQGMEALKEHGKFISPEHRQAVLGKFLGL
ncbi:hypothetical protein EBZ38_03850 [bacterium]|nr:hypothetical protein [bacterium]